MNGQSDERPPCGQIQDGFAWKAKQPAATNIYFLLLEALCKFCKEFRPRGLRHIPNIFTANVLNTLINSQMQATVARYG